jgi:hypothetical protein
MNITKSGWSINHREHSNALIACALALAALWMPVRNHATPDSTSKRD